MYKTWRISFALKNTYRVNTILYAFKQIPLVKRLLPETLYRVRSLKIFANILSTIWELLSVFLGKFLYFVTMIGGIAFLYQKAAPSSVFLHILLLLSVIGAFANTSLFNPTRDKYYAMMLMRMDARNYTLVNYAYATGKVVVGFLPFTVWFGLKSSVPLWLCLCLPFCIAGMKATVTAASLRAYKRNGWVYNENRLGKYQWICMALLLGFAYGGPALGWAIPVPVSAALMLICLPAGLMAMRQIVSFDAYRAVNQQMLSQLMTQMDSPAQISKQMSEKGISADTTLTSGKKGFEYLNELFVKRHQKILWRSAKRISFACCFAVLGLLLAFYCMPQIRLRANELLLTFLPYFVFIMYAINRGTGFTKALFMNCDHSLLTYSFYKQPKCILRLFRIRLREIIKINLPPALILGVGLSALLYASGGTSSPWNYAVMVISLPCMSIFFSVHYLTLYYLLQPYNAGTEMKSGTYQLLMSLTYLACFLMMQVRMPTLVFGAMTIVFCAIYCLAACLLIYRFAPKTFRLRA